MVFVVFFALAICPVIVVAYPGGAPESACGNMMPGHYAPVQNIISPYYLTVNKDNFGPSEQIKVSIHGCGNSGFRGFFLQARLANESSEQAIGNFSRAPGTKGVNCPRSNSAITHTERTYKTEENVYWTSPPWKVGHIVFRATIVSSYDTYWLDIFSETLRDRSLGSAPDFDNRYPTQATCRRSASATTAVPTWKWKETTKTYAHSTRKWPDSPKLSVDCECEYTKGCANLCKNDDSCSTTISWKYNEFLQSVDFQINASVSSTNNIWMAIGFSNDRLMGNDSVVDCLIHNTQFTVRTSYNEPYGKSNSPLLWDFGMSTKHGEVSDGVFSCSFSRPVSDYRGDSRFFDISKPHHILFAWGNVDVYKGTKLHHHAFPLTSEKVDFLSTNRYELLSAGVITSGVNRITYCYFLTIVSYLALMAFF